jgi:hypothetical protein
MITTIIDIEADALKDKVTKIYCLSYIIYDTESKEILERGSITNYLQIAIFILKQSIIVGHNIILYDIPVMEKILNIKIDALLIDTLGLSWYLYPKRDTHGLESWGNHFNIIKPIITDWTNLSIETYVNRCEIDTDINFSLFVEQLEYLFQLYGDNYLSIIKYLSFKLDCIKEQEEEYIKIDLDLVNRSLETLNVLKEEKFTFLKEKMPLDIKYKTVSKPIKMYTKNGELSSLGRKWFNLLEDLSLDSTYEQDIIVESKVNEPNPESTTQLKRWLFSLGWIPDEFEYRKNTVGEVKAVPQIYKDSRVCDSVRALYPIEPVLENLDMLSLITHRIGVFQGFLDSVNEEGFIQAKVHGFTNTLRMRHMKPIANLPKASKFYGQEIRGSIISPSEDYVLCGSDMSSLEDTTKQHYMYFFDPEYVTQMRVPGFDPHLDIALLANMLTEEQVEQHKKKEANYSAIRSKAKVVNFAGIYGAGPPKIALTTGMSINEAKQLHRIYWERNKAVKLVAKNIKIKTIGDQQWCFNPVSKFWYSLRAEKDIFSTINQSTGVYCFDMYIKQVRSKGIKIMLQYHDEIAFKLLVSQQEETTIILNTAIEKVNQILKLNVPLGISIDYGMNYANIH